MGQGVTHVPGKAVYEVVLAAMGFVGDHYHIAPIRQHREAFLTRLGRELLNGGKDHTTGCPVQQPPQIVPAVVLTEQLPLEPA